MQQALLQMHSPWSHALREVTGTTGLRIMRAIVAGERDPQPLAALRTDRCKKEADAMALALTGTWREEHLCVLRQALARCDGSTVQLSACDAQIEGAFSVIKPRCASPLPAPSLPESPTPPRHTPHSHSKNAPAGTPRAPILRMTGVDLGAGHGRSAALAQTILAEMGPAMRKWPDAPPFGSWLGLAPNHAISGGKVLTSRTMKHRHRAAHAFRMAAQSVGRSHGACGAFDRRLQGRLGPAQALVATAHKIARPVYPMRKDRVPSHDIGAAEYNQRFRERELQDLQKQAAKRGYTLSPA
jgi:hypothetical protein